MVVGVQERDATRWEALGAVQAQFGLEGAVRVRWRTWLLVLSRLFSRNSDTELLLGPTMVKLFGTRAHSGVFGDALQAVASAFEIEAVFIHKAKACSRIWARIRGCSASACSWPVAIDP